MEEIRDKIMAAVDLARDALKLSAIHKEKTMKKSRRMKIRFIGPSKIQEKVSDNSVRLEFTSRLQHMKKTIFNVAKPE